MGKCVALQDPWWMESIVGDAGRVFGAWGARAIDPFSIGRADIDAGLSLVLENQ